MAENDDDQHDHCTDEEHAKMAEIAGKAIGIALQTCVEAHVCDAVLYDQMIRALVIGALTHEFTLADVVGDVIDEYLDAAEELKRIRRALRRAERGGSLS